MMFAVDPLLQSLAASPRVGEYAVVLLMADGLERTVLVSVNGTEVALPGAQLLEWSPLSQSYRGLVAAVLALDAARSAARNVRALLRDVDGGWDVSLGNVVLGATGVPACIAHGNLTAVEPGLYRCGECGAQAGFGP
jgi:hypothetical protein